MKETDQLKKLMESIQLNEYLVRPGEPVSAMMQLNIFTDSESRPSEFKEEFRNSPDWMAVEAKYYQIADNLSAAMEKSTATLSDDDVEQIHNVWYDGSDAYDDPEEAVHSLPGIYNAQLEVIREILLSQEVEEGKKLDRFARKVVPGLGKHVAGERAKDNAFGAYLEKGMADIDGDEAGARQSRIYRKAADKYKKIAEATGQPYDIEFDSEDVTIFTPGGEPVLEMPIDAWIALISKFNRQMGRRER